MAAYGLGAAGLAGAGLEQKNEAMQTLGALAEQETSRNIANDQMEAQRKAGNQQLAGTVGAMGGMMLGASYGAAGGPIGALIGGVVGAVAGSLF